MTDFGLMTIGMFARKSGLTSSALRFYADAGLMLPARVDRSSGYRFYGEDQIERAVVLRRLRKIGISLATAKSVLDADVDEAIRLIDEHVDTVAKDATTARQQSDAIKSTLTGIASATVVAMSGPVLAAAIEQVLTATSNEPGVTVLGGVRFEAQTGTVAVTATDRYRLSTRTLTTTNPTAIAWAATVNGDDLRSCLADLRRTAQARIEATAYGLWMRLPNCDDRYCRLLTEPFPDYRLMLDDMPAITTRVQVSTAMLRQALEDSSAALIGLRVTEIGVDT